MTTTAELRAFADKTSIVVPTIDYQVGVPAGTALKSFLTIGSTIPGVIYNPLTKTLHIKQDGVTLSGYNFGGVTVSVEANNVTLKNSAFDASHGVYSVIQAKGKAGLTVEHSSFDGLKLNKPFADFIHGGDGFVKIAYNSFKNAPSDAIQLKQGVVDHNFISGGGYATGAHADAISIDGANGKITITNNFIDYRNAADAPAKTTSALAIGNYFGDNQDIVVQKNILLGGAYTVYVQDFGTYNYSKVEITGNIVGSGTWGDLYPNRRPDELVFQNDSKTQIGNVPVEIELATMAAAIPAPAPEPAPSQIGEKIFGKGVVGNEMLQGTAGTDWIYGNGGGDVLIGGGGRDFLFGGRGVDIFVYHSVADSAGKNADVIAGFEASVDKINLKALSGATQLSYIGEQAFNGKAGAVHAVKSGGSTWVEVDMNADRVADMRVEIKGLHNLSGIDFIL
jgi:serralysin